MSLYKVETLGKMDQMVLQRNIDQLSICLDGGTLSGEKYLQQTNGNVVFTIFSQEQIRETQEAVIRLGELEVHTRGPDCSGPEKMCYFPPARSKLTN